MDRVKGLPAFVIVAAVVLGGLRLLHVGIPVLLPETRQGPLDVSNLDEVQARAGFAPIIPAYRPESLGRNPVSMQVVLSPRPAFTIVWENEGQYLSVTQRQGGPRPAAPPLSQPLAGVADSMWWTAGGRQYLILERAGFWFEVETTFPARDLKRFADTLAPHR